MQSPQLEITICLSSIKLREKHSKIGCKITIYRGKAWQLASGDETYDSKLYDRKPHDLTYEINESFNFILYAKDIFGWPKIIVEVFKYDKGFTSMKLVGLASISIPYAKKTLEFEAGILSPKKDTVFGIDYYKTFKYKELFITGQERFSLETVSSGIIKGEMHISSSYFEENGIEFN